MSRLKWTNSQNEDVFIARGHLSDVNLSYHREFWNFGFLFHKHFSQEWRHENGIREKYEAYHLLTSTFFSVLVEVFLITFMSAGFRKRYFHIKIFITHHLKNLGQSFSNLSIKQIFFLVNWIVNCKMNFGWNAKNKWRENFCCYKLLLSCLTFFKMPFKLTFRTGWAQKSFLAISAYQVDRNNQSLFLSDNFPDQLRNCDNFFNRLRRWKNITKEFLQ